jgi:hypothetical protein
LLTQKCPSFFILFFSSLFPVLTYIRTPSSTIQRRARTRDFSLSQPTLSTPIFQYYYIHPFFFFIPKDEQHAGRQEIEGKERMACSSSWFRGWRLWVSKICNPDFIPLSPSFQATFRKSSWSLWLPHNRSTKGTVFCWWFSSSPVEDWKGVQSS